MLLVLTRPHLLSRLRVPPCFRPGLGVVNQPRRYDLRFSFPSLRRRPERGRWEELYGAPGSTRVKLGFFMKTTRTALAFLALCTFSLAAAVDPVGPGPKVAPGQVWSVEWPDGSTDLIPVPLTPAPEDETPEEAVAYKGRVTIGGVDSLVEFITFPDPEDADLLEILEGKLTVPLVFRTCVRYLRTSDRPEAGLMGVFGAAAMDENIAGYIRSGEVDGRPACLVRLVSGPR